MKFTLPVVCLALSIPAAVVAATGGAGSVQAEKATAAEAAVAKSFFRSPKIKVRRSVLLVASAAMQCNVCRFSKNLAMGARAVCVHGRVLFFFWNDFSLRMLRHKRRHQAAFVFHLFVCLHGDQDSLEYISYM